MPSQEPEQQLTPYQGKRRAFGKFTCERCDHEWYSAHSWANTYQQCKECKEKVYPNAQWKIKPSDGKRKSNKPHLQSLCGKCKKIGSFCSLRRQA